MPKSEYTVMNPRLDPRACTTPRTTFARNGLSMGLEGSLQRGDLCRKPKIDFVGSPKFCRKISGSSCILAPAFPHQESSDGLPTKSIYRQNLRESLRHLSVFRQKLSEDRIPRLLWISKTELKQRYRSPRNNGSYHYTILSN